VAAYLGELDRQGRLGVARAAQPDSAQQADLFRQEPGAEWVEVDLNGVRVERRRPFGGSWLGLLLLGHSSRAAGLFRVEVEAGAEGGAHLTWTKRDERREWMKLSEGCYLLPSNVTDWSGEELWRAYIQLTEAEEALRLHKGDLVMRPVWHQKEDRVQAHILFAFWPMCSGKRWASGVNAPASATNRARSSPSWNKSLWSMLYCPRGPALRYANAVSAAPTTTKPFCSSGSAWKSPLASILQTCSEDFAMPTLKTKDLLFKLRKLGWHRLGCILLLFNNLRSCFSLWNDLSRPASRPGCSIGRESNPHHASRWPAPEKTKVRYAGDARP
jgi:hypothetical protein